jgi:hypothetical protein
VAQYGPLTPDVQPNNYPPALPERRTKAPKLVFELVGEVTLPGPLGDAPAWIADEQVVIPVQGGLARVAPDPDATPSVGPGEAPPPPAGWVVSPDAPPRRFRATPEGIVECQRWSKSRKRWVHRWKIVAPNSLLSMPVLVGPRLCYAGLDDRVTCVRASNGHRLWSVDLGDRISWQIAAWPAALVGDIEKSILLVVPDDGARIIALDAFDGRRIAAFELTSSRRFVSSPLVLGGDRIAVARKGYDDAEAALVLLRLAPAPETGKPAAVPYNDAASVPAGTPGR